MKTNIEAETKWCHWFGWYTEKIENWLETQASSGRHVVGADRWLNRFHFQRGKPRSVRFYADYPARPDDEYFTIFEDAGWELIAHDLGWYIWKAEYEGNKRPQAINNPEPLMERNNRLIMMMVGTLIGLIAAAFAQLPLIMKDRAPYLKTPFGTVFMTFYAIVTFVVVWALIAMYRQNVKIKQRL